MPALFCAYPLNFDDMNPRTFSLYGNENVGNMSVRYPDCRDIIGPKKGVGMSWNDRVEVEVAVV